MSTPSSAIVAAHGLPRAPQPEEALQRERVVHATVAMVVLAVCAAAATLSSGGDPIRARLDVRGAGTQWICLDHQRLTVHADDAGFAALPPGQRVTLGVAGGTEAGAQCRTGASFVPQAGRAYFATFETVRGRCGVVVYREVKSNRLGLGIEPSLAPAADCIDR